MRTRQIQSLKLCVRKALYHRYEETLALKCINDVDKELPVSLERRGMGYERLSG